MKEGFNLMEIIHSAFPDCDLVKAKGRVDGYTAPQLSSKLNSIVSNGRYNIILDMSDVVYVSSAGLRVMIDIQNSCRHNMQGETVLLQIPQRIYETLEITGLLPLYRLFDTLENAIKYFAKSVP